MGKAAEFIGAAQAAELQAALRELSDEAGDVLLSALEDIAKEVATGVAGKVPYRSGAARATYRAQGRAIAWGGESAPYVPWLEFGGKVGRKDSVSRPYSRKGRYLYPTIAEKMSDIAKRVDDLLSDAVNGYLEVD